MKVRDYSHDTGMSFVPEWSSYCIHMTKSTGSALGVVAILKTIRTRPSPQTTRFAVFISGRSSFSVNIIPEWNVIAERKFHSDWKPEWLVRERNFVSISRNQIQRNIRRWNELVAEWKSFRYHANSPFPQTPVDPTNSIHPGHLQPMTRISLLLEH